MSILRYAGKRIVLSALTLLLVTVITFAFTQILPGDAAQMILGMQASDEQLAAVREQLGLNRPLWVQYLDWVTGFVTGDLGTSFVYSEPVSDTILTRLPRSIYLTVASMVIAVSFAIPLGIYSSTKQGEPVDLAVSTFVFAGISVPNFFWGLVFILVFASYLDILPVSGYVAPSENFVEFLKRLIMPAAALGWALMAQITRMTRSSMLEVFSENYIETAKSKGVSQRGIVYKHAFLNALIPTLTVIGFQIGYLFGGAIVIEQVFSWPGIGSLVFNAVLERDLPVIQASVVVITTVFIVSNLIVDLLYGVIDPRIRYGGEDS